jgi:hypothetical protein
MKEFKLLIQDLLETVICDIESRPAPNIGDNDIPPQYLWECGIKQGKKEAFEEMLKKWPVEKKKKR